jgi:hypothetical protein
MTYTQEQIKLIKTELRSVNVELYFEDLLNDMEPEINLAGCEYGAGTVLKKIDYINFRESMNCWIDGMIQDELFTDEIDGEHYMKDDVDELLESQRIEKLIG